MKLESLTAISAIDGRYRDKCASLANIVSEYGLHRYRVQTEVEWFIALSQNAEIPELPEISMADVASLRDCYLTFSVADAQKIKQIEATTNHDVKAVEYFVKDQLANISSLDEHKEFIHFACTSEDINNTAYALMVKDARELLLTHMNALVTTLTELADTYAANSMLSKTHGQAASPTTVGKEFANFSSRLSRQYGALAQQEILGKFNGAVGNFNAHVVAYPNIDWPTFSSQFLESLGITQNAYTTQIEPHDFLAETLHTLIRFNQVLIDCDRDMWGYISSGVFTQRKVAGETGSSTMPHKVNPIDFENSEGNLGVANALMEHLSNKLPISRWQRDLSDSTVLRNLGSCFGHCLVAYAAAQKGLTKLELDREHIASELDVSWEVLAEPVQTVMRKYGLAEPYERLKEATRGVQLDQSTYHKVLASLDLPKAARDELFQLTPEGYTGVASELAQNVTQQKPNDG